MAAFSSAALASSASFKLFSISCYFINSYCFCCSSANAAACFAAWSSAASGCCSGAASSCLGAASGFASSTSASESSDFSFSLELLASLFLLGTPAAFASDSLFTISYFSAAASAFSCSSSSRRFFALASLYYASFRYFSINSSSSFLFCSSILSCSTIAANLSFSAYLASSIFF